MTKIKEVRVTCAEIARDADLDQEYVRLIMAQYEPMGVDDSGAPQYSIAQMMGAMFRGEVKEKTER